MSKILKIGIVGCGAIGSSLARAIVSDFSGKAELVSVYDIDKKKILRLVNKFNNPRLATLSLDELIKGVDLVIEATEAKAAFDIAKKAISSSKDIMIMSVGGIIQYYKELEVLAKERNVRIFIPSGAICGIDGLKAVSFGKINKVTLTTKKPPAALALDNINEDTVIFEGDALTATRSFPQNINVAATLSIAGMGAQNTMVRIVASPHIKRNIHEIEIDSEAGKIFTRTENVVHPDNPKTSYLAVLSAIATLKQILEPIKIGT